MLTKRVASVTPVSPHALKNSPEPPKVAAPKLNADTFSPERPSCLYSMSPFSFGGDCRVPRRQSARNMDRVISWVLIRHHPLEELRAAIIHDSKFKSRPATSYSIALGVDPACDGPGSRKYGCRSTGW